MHIFDLQLMALSAFIPGYSKYGNSTWTEILAIHIASRALYTGIQYSNMPTRRTPKLWTVERTLSTCEPVSGAVKVSSVHHTYMMSTSYLDFSPARTTYPKSPLDSQLTAELCIRRSRCPRAPRSVFLKLFNVFCVYAIYSFFNLSYFSACPSFAHILAH